MRLKKEKKKDINYAQPFPLIVLGVGIVVPSVPTAEKVFSEFS